MNLRTIYKGVGEPQKIPQHPKTNKSKALLPLPGWWGEGRKGLSETEESREHSIKKLWLGAPGWLSQLSIWLQLRSWSQGSWVCWALHTQSQCRTCFGTSVSLSLSLSLPLPHLCSLSKINIKTKNTKKQLWPSVKGPNLLKMIIPNLHVGINTQLHLLSSLKSPVVVSPLPWPLTRQKHGQGPIIWPVIWRANGRKPTKVFI